MHICEQCNLGISDTNIICTSEGYYHTTCYIAYLLDILQIIYHHAETIIACTQGNNAKANSKARVIIRKLKEL